jgi:acyl carrier protein
MTYKIEDLREMISLVRLSPIPETSGNDADLFENGLLDSISVVQLITKLEEKFDISFKFEHLTKNNFQNILSIAQMLTRDYAIHFA